MGKHGIFWVSLMNQRNTLWRFNEDPNKTERFISSIINKDLEGQTPPEGDFAFSSYQWKSYTINRNGIVKSLEWTPMKYGFHKKKRWPRIKIKTYTKEGDNFLKKEKEVSILFIMDKVFWPYIKWYSRKKENPNWFILVTKDWNFENISYNNLEYVSKSLYREKWTKRGKIRLILTSTKWKDKELAKNFNTSRSEIQKEKKKLADEGNLPHYQHLLELRDLLGFTISEDSVPIYEALLQCYWKLSNWEIASILYKEQYINGDEKEKKRLSSKIVRARKQLSDRGLLPRFNENFESKKEDAIKMLSEKDITWHTNKQIAEILWLNLTQVNNLARQIKKSVKD